MISPGPRIEDGKGRLMDSIIVNLDLRTIDVPSNDRPGDATLESATFPPSEAAPCGDDVLPLVPLVQLDCLLLSFNHWRIVASPSDACATVVGVGPDPSMTVSEVVRRLESVAGFPGAVLPAVATAIDGEVRVIRQPQSFTLFAS